MAEQIIDGPDRKMLYSEEPLVYDEQGNLDGEIIVVKTEQTRAKQMVFIRQIPSNIIFGEN